MIPGQGAQQGAERSAQKTHDLVYYLQTPGLNSAVQFWKRQKTFRDIKALAGEGLDAQLQSHASAGARFETPHATMKQVCLRLDATENPFAQSRAFEV